MKNKLNIPAIGTFALFLFIASSCSKTIENGPPPPCNPCSPPPTTKSVTLGTNNWQTIGGGVFSTDFAAALNTATGGYAGIANTYLEYNGQEYELPDGNEINALGGQLRRSGTHLNFKAGISSQLSAVQSMLLRVIVY